MLVSKDPVVNAALSAYRVVRAREVVANAAARRITNPVVADAVRKYSKLVMNGAVDAPDFAANGEMTDEDKRKRGWKQDKDGNWHTKGWKGEESGGEQTSGVTEAEKEAISRMSESEKAQLKGEVEKRLEEIKQEKQGGDNAGGGAVEKKPEGAAGEKAPVDYGSKVQNTVNGIPAKEVGGNFSMGISTGSRDGDIKECYERAAASQKEFGAAVDGVAEKLGMKRAEFDGDHPIIGDGAVFFTRPKLKKEERVREKMDENDAESEKTGKPNGGINDIVDINGSTLVLGDDGDFKTAVEGLRKSGMEVVRVKNCFENAAFDNTGYGDVKVNVRTSNGFVGEVIIADRYMTEQKMNGAGHGLYEVARSLTKAIDAKKPDVVEGARKCRKAMNELSRLVYLKKGEDHTTFDAKLKAASEACQSLSGIVNDPANGNLFDAKFKEQLPALIEKIKDPKTYDGYRAELKKRGI